MIDQSAPDRPVPGIKALREKIPKHCFEPDIRVTVGYIVRDLCLVAALVYCALQITAIDSQPLRWISWATYGFCQGLVCTGIWIIAHECGHGAIFKSTRVADVVGFVLHSALLVPYFSWKYSHARHHRYTNNVDRDTAFVPPKGDEFRLQKYLASVLDMAEDSPILALAVLVLHQIVGWPAYLLFNITAGQNSSAREQDRHSLSKSHLDPTSMIFSREELKFVLISDLGLLGTALGLTIAGQSVGFQAVLLLYFVPWLWVNHWIVAITFMHHNHSSVSHFENDAWTFQKGALSTVDRDFGFIGRHLFHGIIEYHVIHHLFPRIPFYRAEEATFAIRESLGKNYVVQKTSFLGDFWRTFSSLTHVESAECSPGVLKWSHKSLVKSDSIAW